MINFFNKLDISNHCDYIHNKVSPGLTKSRFPVCFFRIVSLFASDCKNQITSLHIMQNTLFIEGSYKGEQNELMLRYGYADNNIGFVIARIQFINQKKGYLSELITILEDIKNQYNLGEIMIECANTNEIKNWLKKNNWVEYRCKNNYISLESSRRILK